MIGKLLRIWVTLSLASLLSGGALAAEIPFAGRLTESTGKPLAGPVVIEARFFDGLESTNQLGTTLSFPTTTLVDGTFQVVLSLLPADADAVLSSPLAFIEIKAAGKTYPRQRFYAVPFALRTPVDNKSLAYDATTGKLAVAKQGASSGQILTWNDTANSWIPASAAGANIGPNDITNAMLAGSIDQGKITGLVAALADKAPVAHTHANAEIAAGVAAAKIGGGGVDDGEFGFLNGVTSSIQTQIDTKASTIHGHSALDANDGNPVNALKVDDVGYVGIGTTSPASALDVNGIIHTNHSMVILRNGSDTPEGGAYLGIKNADASKAWDFQLSTGNHLNINNYSGGWQNRLTILDGGNVGIGTTGPESLFDVRGTSSAQYAKIGASAWSLRFGSLQAGHQFLSLGVKKSAADNTYVAETGDDPTVSHLILEMDYSGGGAFNFLGQSHVADETALSPTNLLHIGGDGNVGIGTSSPSELLNLQSGTDADLLLQTSTSADKSSIFIQRSRGTVAAPTILVSTDVVGTLTYKGYDGAAFQDVASINADVDTTPGAGDMPGRITFSTTSDNTSTLLERMRIDSSGKVGIGTTNPAGKLEVSGGQVVGSFLADTDLNINFDSGNIQSTSAAAGTLDLSNMKDGASYTLVLTAGSTSPYTLSGSGITTWRCAPACASNQITGTSGKHTIVSVMKIGVVGYVSWLKDM